MSLKSKTKLLIAGALAVTGLNIPIIDGTMKIKLLKPLKKSKKPKTQADYEAMHAAEMKRRRKAEKRILANVDKNTRICLETLTNQHPKLDI